MDADKERGFSRQIMEINHTCSSPAKRQLYQHQGTVEIANGEATGTPKKKKHEHHNAYLDILYLFVIFKMRPFEFLQGELEKNEKATRIATPEYRQQGKQQKSDAGEQELSLRQRSKA